MWEKSNLKQFNIRQLSQPIGLMFCRLPVFPSCLPIFGLVPVLIRSLSYY